MPKIAIPEEANAQGQYSGPSVQKPVNPAHGTWHAQIPGGGAVALVAGFTDPGDVYADRIPELALAGGGAPGSYVVTGTWNSLPQTETIGPTVAGATVKGNKPFDTITGMTGPDPVAALDIYHGDTFAEPPARLLYTGNGGDFFGQLSGETAMNVLALTLPAQADWCRRIVRINRTTTTITGAWLGW